MFFFFSPVFILVKSYSRPFVLQRIVKKALFVRFLRSITDHLFDNLESGKRNHCFGKKSEKSLEFWIPKSVRTLCLKMFKHEFPWNNPRRYSTIHLLKAPFLWYVFVLCHDPKGRLRMTFFFVRISDGLWLGIKRERESLLAARQLQSNRHHMSLSTNNVRKRYL